MKTGSKERIIKMKPIEWLGNSLKILDQTQLPQKEIYLTITDYKEAVTAIKQLKVRGAPAIGIAAAYGIALGALSIHTTDFRDFNKKLDAVFKDFAASRPTAVNLFHAITLLKNSLSMKDSVSSSKQTIIDAAMAIHANEEKAMTLLSEHGAKLLKDGFNILTHCNTGQLATGVTYGTALGVIKKAFEQGKRLTVYVDETRPLLQGARLTTWELDILKIPHILISDNMAGHFMHNGQINCVILGADRIAANGDTANKIGTYSLSVLAQANLIPFYVAAPISTIDPSTASGAGISIEERNADEVLQIKGVRIAPDNTRAANPAFDVTPNKYITAIVTQNGIIKKPFKRNIKSVFQEEH
jgi:methylthioribose-1-phosphate isomerase